MLKSQLQKQTIEYLKQEIERLNGENYKLRKDPMRVFGQMMFDTVDAISDLHKNGYDPDQTTDEKLNAYIDAWRSQKEEIEKLKAENERLGKVIKAQDCCLDVALIRYDQLRKIHRIATSNEDVAKLVRECVTKWNEIDEKILDNRPEEDAVVERFRVAHEAIDQYESRQKARE